MEAGVQPHLNCSAASEGDHSLLLLLQLGEDAMSRPCPEHLLQVSHAIQEFRFARFTQFILLVTYSHSDLTKISLKATFT